MARSKAKKHRLKQIREGKLDPTLSREMWAINPVARKTPTKVERIRKREKKHFSNDLGGVFYLHIA
ncbi:uracil phosphoribosyltransferase [Laceyella sacchari]|jgi:hypothetical protein|uniref:Uncharacterized protein n=1 Tax=Laceyella tengchongensis TaxID=574699 RepID=A0AA46AF46_9BACL|nr:uracil phosphoribosyltransferase [Laceyella tengchongensis]AUS09015.1 uracil phosphoribosyltransferase [Laceyella sacchari]SMP16716.1 hypothetical protein SAMN06265361_10327 [Laceyella tengchongensis]